MAIGWCMCPPHQWPQPLFPTLAVRFEATVHVGGTNKFAVPAYANEWAVDLFHCWARLTTVPPTSIWVVVSGTRAAD